MTSAQVLEKVDIFTDLDPKQLAKNYGICKEAVYFQGEVIFTENSPSTEFYVILEGEIALVDLGLRSASAVCNTMLCKTAVIRREDLMKLLKSDPEMGFTIMTNLATELCTKIRLSNWNLREALLYVPHQE
jgi:CRP-like cAMP-binding protein